MLHKKFHQQFLDIIYICAFTDLSYKTLVNCTNSYGYVSLLKKMVSSEKLHPAGETP